MLPDLSLLLALVFGLQALGGTPKDLAFTLAGTVGSLIAGVALIRVSADRGVAAVAENDPLGTAASLRWTSLAPLLGWAACIGLFGWGALVADAVPRIAWLGRHLVLFLPAAVLFAAGWIARARVETAVRAARGGPSLAVTPVDAVRQHVRRNALALLPMLVVIGLFESFYVLGELGVPGVARASRWVETLPLLTLAVSMTLLTLLSLLLPRLLRRVFQTEPLPAGDLRDLLERSAKAMGLRYGELVVWKTGGKVLNAMVVGLTGRTRVIFVTDGLVARLPTEEVLAVFAHEAGHAKRHHLPLYLLLFFGFALLFDSVADPLLAAGLPGDLLDVLQIGLLWFGLVGWLSRKFEREADVYGADHATAAVPDPGPVLLPGASRPVAYGAALMVRALDRIGKLTGHTRSFRHGSIEDRIRYVATYGSEPEAREEFRRQRRLLYVGIAAFTVAALAVAAVQLPGQIRIADAHIRTRDAASLHLEADRRRREEGRPAARDAYRRAFEAWTAADGRLGSDDDERARVLRFTILFNQADTALRGSGDLAAARAALERVVKLGPVPPSHIPDSVPFLARVDLGRIAAAEGDLAEAREHLEKARALLPDRSGDEGALLRARFALLQDVIEAREGVPTGRTELERKARAPRFDTDDWRDFWEDAKDDLARLPPPQ